MAIEFPCSHCGRRLKVPEEAAGKQAQCPVCIGLTPIPGIGGQQATPPRIDLGGDSAGAAFNPYIAPGAPTAEGSYQSYSPHAAPVAPASEWSYRSKSLERRAAAAKVSGPATALIVLAVLGIIGGAIGSMSWFLIPMAMDAGGNIPPDMEEAAVQAVLGGVASIVGLAVSLLILVGAIKMLRLESQGWAKTAAVLAMIPCISPCCVLGLPFGIWAFVALDDPLVKSAFGRRAQSQARF